jgi:hypothetical protein
VERVVEIAAQEVEYPCSGEFLNTGAITRNAKTSNEHSTGRSESDVNGTNRLGV